MTAWESSADLRGPSPGRRQRLPGRIDGGPKHDRVFAAADFGEVQRPINPMPAVAALCAFR